MEVSRFRILFLTLLAATVLPGCSMLGGRSNDKPEPVAPVGEAAPVTGEPDRNPVIDPQVERREIRRSRIDTEDFELGAYVGVLSIEDFESNVVYGARLAYHLTEDFFLEGTVGQSRAGRTSYENLSGSADLLTDSDLGHPDRRRRRSRLHLLRAVDGLERAARRNLRRQGPRI